MIARALLQPEHRRILLWSRAESADIHEESTDA